MKLWKLEEQKKDAEVEVHLNFAYFLNNTTAMESMFTFLALKLRILTF